MANAVAAGLRRRGIDVLTTTEAGLRGAPDAEIMAQSHAAGRVIVTSDPDFLELHGAGGEHAGIAYYQQRSRTIGQLVSALVLIYEVLEPGDMVSRVEFL